MAHKWPLTFRNQEESVKEEQKLFLENYEDIYYTHVRTHIYTHSKVPQAWKMRDQESLVCFHTWAKCQDNNLQNKEASGTLYDNIGSFYTAATRGTKTIYFYNLY